MGDAVSFVLRALILVTMPLYLFSLLVKGLRSKKPVKEWVVELAVLTVIAFIMAAILLPDIYKFQARAKNSQPAANLDVIFRLQIEYHATTGDYAGGPDAFMYLNWEPDGPSAYSYFCGDDYIPNSLQLPDYFLPKRLPRIGREHRPAITASSATGFTCTAVGNIDNDPDLDYWYINDAKIIVNEPSDL